MPLALSWLRSQSAPKAATSALLVAALVVVAAECWRRRRKHIIGVVTSLHRFAVKGLGSQQLRSCSLEVGSCFPSDRMWALMRADRLTEFNPKDPKWVSKMSFYGACSAGGQLARLETTYFDATATLRVFSKEVGNVLLEARLVDDKERAEAEVFFSNYLSNIQEQADVRIVCADEGKPHHFANTDSGEQATGDIRIIHLLNLATLRALCEASGEDINPLRFRANILFDGVPPWEEFKWVGHTICVGGVEMRVVKRTVRCRATCFDLDTGVDAADVPGLLQRIYPEHGPHLGIYAQVTRAGSIQCGDRVSF